jgi:hypothetical protein
MTAKSPCRFLGALLLLGSAAASIQAAETSCDTSSLKGSYDFSGSGQVIPMIETEPGKPGVFIYELREVTVTGNIAISADQKGKASIRLDTFTEGFPSGSTTGEGNYKVGADCKGTLTFSTDDKPPFTWSYDFELEKDGKFRFVSATGNNKLIAGRAWQTAAAPSGK